MLINISRTDLSRSVYFLFIKGNIIFEDWLRRPSLGSSWACVEGWKRAFGLLERTRLLVVLGHLSPELIACLNAQGITRLCHVSTSPLGSWDGSLSLGYRVLWLQSRTHSLTICWQMVFLEWGSGLLSLFWEPNTGHITTKLACHLSQPPSCSPRSIGGHNSENGPFRLMMPHLALIGKLHLNCILAWDSSTYLSLMCFNCSVDSGSLPQVD